MCAARPSPVRTACATHSRLMTGSIPGNAASMKLTCVFGGAPYSVAAPENSLARLMTCACTSSPITSSHAPDAPSTV